MVRGSMREVELPDGDDDGAGQVDVPGRPRRARRWWVAGAVAVVALALVCAQRVVDAREEAAVAALARVPGALPVLGDGLEVARRLSLAGAADLWSRVTVGPGRSASLVVGDDGSQAVTATDLRTGETLWSTPMLGPDPARAAAPESSDGSGCQPRSAGAAVAASAVCLVTDGFVRPGPDGTDLRVAATSSRVVVLDTGDGQVTAEWDVPDTARQFAVVPGVAVVGALTDGGVRLIGYDLGTGLERWRDVVPFVHGSAGTDGNGRDWGLFAAGEVVVLYDVDSFTLLSATGSRIRDDLEYGMGLGADPVTGRLVITDYPSTGTQTTTLLSRDGKVAGDLVVQGALVSPTLDDGTVPATVLTSLENLHAWDRRTGDELWEAAIQPGAGAVVVRGRIYLTTTTEVVALDGRTGDVVWRTDLPRLGPATLSTDGRDLLLMSASNGTDPGGLTGYDFATGAQTRQLPFPEPVSQIELIHGLLVGWSRDGDELLVFE